MIETKKSQEGKYLPATLKKENQLQEVEEHGSKTDRDFTGEIPDRT